MKVFKVIKKIISTILLIIFFAFAILMTVFALNRNKYGVTRFGDTSLVIMNSKSTSEKYKNASLLLIDLKPIEEIKVGDEIFVYVVDAHGNVSIDYGNVGAVHIQEEAISFDNSATYHMEFVIGEVSKVYDKIGLPLSIVQSKWGFLFIVLVPIFLIFVYQVYELIVEIKYGDDKE